MYLIGQPRPLLPAELPQTARPGSPALPPDYLEFLATYGYGEVNELLLFGPPDADHFRSTFSDCLDIWDWVPGSEALALAGTTVATTNDGDIVLAVAGSHPYLLMPRHATEPVLLPSLAAVLARYETTYAQQGGQYFDPSFDWEQKHFDMAGEIVTRAPRLARLHQEFLATFRVDKSFNLEIQPKYVLQNMGGWVHFDLVYSSAVWVKYQAQFQAEAEAVIRFLAERLGNATRSLAPVG
ncbi:MAG: hypothetical protein ACRYFX_14770 [Janthinobacterium lividum]